MGYPKRLAEASTAVFWTSTSLLVLLLLSVCLRSNMARAQIPGMLEPPAPEVEAASVEVDATPETETAPSPGAPNGFLQLYHRYFGPGSPYRSLLLTILTLLVLLRLNSYLSRKIENELRIRAFDPDNVKSFMQVWRGTWKFVITILVLIAMTGSLRLLGLTAGFIGMMLGWSLQQPVTGLAAWLMIVLKKPFRIGDRVIIAGITGDVTAITLTHVILNQVGGSIGGEERSGRGILIPNAILFQNVIINYTLEQKHMLDEVPVRLTFDSDWGLAKKIMISAAEEATGDIIRETGEQPFIRAEFLDWGILVRLRYQTIPARRQEISTDIIEILLREFSRHYPRVRFANPATTIRYRPDEPEGDPGKIGETPAGTD
jgi:small-conductance mechanosensitive channel